MPASSSRNKCRKSFSLKPTIVQYIVVRAEASDLNESETLEKIIEEHQCLTMEQKLKEGYIANNKANKETAELFKETIHDHFS